MHVAFPRIAFLSLLLLPYSGLMAFAQAEKPNEGPASIVEYHARIPLGWECFKLNPSGQLFYLMGSVEDAEFEGWQKVTQDDRTRLVSANDSPVKRYPQHLQFRITASAKERLIEKRPFLVNSRLSINTYLLGLRFRLAVFHGLEEWKMRPVAVESIGMPADVSYDERIYRVRFNLGEIPIEDRIVLEVLAPNGQRLSKFHVDLY